MLVSGVVHAGCPEQFRADTQPFGHAGEVEGQELEHADRGDSTFTELCPVTSNLGVLLACITADS